MLRHAARTSGDTTVVRSALANTGAATSMSGPRCCVASKLSRMASRPSTKDSNDANTPSACTGPRTSSALAVSPASGRATPQRWPQPHPAPPPRSLLRVLFDPVCVVLRSLSLGGVRGWHHVPVSTCRNTGTALPVTPRDSTTEPSNTTAPPRNTLKLFCGSWHSASSDCRRSLGLPCNRLAGQ